MNKFRDALYRFMYGRNGVDALNWALVILELAVSVLSSIIRVQGVSQALYFVSMGGADEILDQNNGTGGSTCIPMKTE